MTPPAQTHDLAEEREAAAPPAKPLGIQWRTRPHTRRIIVHDSHTPSWIPSATAYLRTKGRAKGLLEVGYHYVIERGGEVFCTRAHQAMGSHCPGHNHDSIGVCLAGGEEGADDFTVAQLSSLIALIAYLQSEYPDEPLQVRGHSEVTRHTHRNRAKCPCLDMGALRDSIRGYIEMEQTPQTTDGKLSAQNTLVLDYMKTGRTLTNVIAIVSLGVGSLTSRIAELRALGYKITDTWAKDHHGKDYKKYRLADTEAGEAEAA